MFRALEFRRKAAEGGAGEDLPELDTGLSALRIGGGSETVDSPRRN